MQRCVHQHVRANLCEEGTVWKRVATAVAATIGATTAAATGRLSFCGRRGRGWTDRGNEGRSLRVGGRCRPSDPRNSVRGIARRATTIALLPVLAGVVTGTCAAAGGGELDPTFGSGGAVL